jgi:hypothetical protein
MREGLVVDFNYTGVMPSLWVEDKTQISAVAGGNVNSKRKVRTVTYRCAACGYLDSYAK